MTSKTLASMKKQTINCLHVGGLSGIPKCVDNTVFESGKTYFSPSYLISIVNLLRILF